MKILVPISVATGLAFAGMAGVAAAQGAAQPPGSTLAQANAVAPVSGAAADASGNAAGNIPAIPDQTQSPGNGAGVMTATVTNGPVPDTPANRAKYGAPMSHAGKRSPSTGN
jgi:hypothetical protein